ncbi:phosphotransferase [Streptomyces sp. NPDC055815]
MMPPTAADVLAMAGEQVLAAVRLRWPGAEVVPGPVTPSVTSYVQPLEVDGRLLYAKVSVCGVSLVSVLRGACGDLATLRARQAAYLVSPGSLMAREAAQLRTLAGPAALGTVPLAEYSRGVLFTEPVPGPTLADLMEAEPGRTSELLGLVVRDVAEGLAREGVAAAVDRGQIRERGIGDTFARKFNGLSGLLYLRETGYGDVLDGVVIRLRRARRAPSLPGVRGVVFGDLKPEHAVFPDGPAGRPVFLDPGLMRGHAVADTAKLVSRTVLGLIGLPSAPDAARVILAGLDPFVRATARRLPDAEREAWMRELVLLVLMDTTCILTTYLTAPADLPLSAHAAGLRARAHEVTGLLDRATAPLLAAVDGPTLWRLYLTCARKAVHT